MLWNKKTEEEDRLPDLPFQSRKMSDSASPVFENSDDEHFESIKTSEKHELPAFPDSPMDKGFSQTAIKEAVSSDEEKIPLPPSQNNEPPLLPKPQNQQNTFIQPNPFLNDNFNAHEEDIAEPSAVTRLKSESKPAKMVEMPHEYPIDAPRPPTSAKPQTPKIPKMIQPIPLNISDDEPIKREAKGLPKSEDKTTDVFVKIDKFYSAKKALSTIKQDVKEIESILSKIRETKMREEREIAVWEKNISSLKEEIGNISESLFSKST